MDRKRVVLGLLVLIGIASLTLGCGPRVVMVRPPEPRVETYGPSPYPDAVWQPGYWDHRRGEWFWVPGHWARPPRPHANWVPGHWEPRRRGWVWIPGHWEHR